jgi:hypothetical protein
MESRLKDDFLLKQLHRQKTPVWEGTIDEGFDLFRRITSLQQKSGPQTIGQWLLKIDPTGTGVVSRNLGPILDTMSRSTHFPVPDSFHYQVLQALESLTATEISYLNRIRLLKLLVRHPPKTALQTQILEELPRAFGWDPKKLNFLQKAILFSDIRESLGGPNMFRSEREALQRLLDVDAAELPDLKGLLETTSPQSLNELSKVPRSYRLESIRDDLLSLVSDPIEKGELLQRLRKNWRTIPSNLQFELTTLELKLAEELDLRILPEFLSRFQETNSLQLERLVKLRLARSELQIELDRFFKNFSDPVRLGQLLELDLSSVQWGNSPEIFLKSLSQRVKGKPSLESDFLEFLLRHFDHLPGSLDNVVPERIVVENLKDYFLQQDPRFNLKETSTQLELLLRSQQTPEVTKALEESFHFIFEQQYVRETEAKLLQKKLTSQDLYKSQKLLHSLAYESLENQPHAPGSSTVRRLLRENYLKFPLVNLEPKILSPAVAQVPLEEWALARDAIEKLEATLKAHHPGSNAQLKTSSLADQYRKVPKRPVIPEGRVLPPEPCQLATQKILGQLLGSFPLRAN